MGTNYYYVSNVCSQCGHQEELHIGKSSGGWCFALRVYPERNIKDLPDWLPLWLHPAAIFRDEYGKSCTVVDVLRVICVRIDLRPAANQHDQAFLDRNSAVPGPNGLTRAKIGLGCISHGAGTWDCCEGEFS